MTRWVDVPGFAGRYQVSDEGAVRSCAWGRWLILRPALTAAGYATVHLRPASGKGRTHYVHRLVAEAYLPNPEQKRTVNHKNGLRADNRYSNLEWATHSENHNHAYQKLGRRVAHNRPLLGESADGSHWTFVDSAVTAAEAFGVTPAAIGSAARRGGSSCGYRWSYADA